MLSVCPEPAAMIPRGEAGCSACWEGGRGRSRGEGRHVPRARVTPAAAGGAGRCPSTRVCPSLSDKPPPSPREQPIPARSSQVGGGREGPLGPAFQGEAAITAQTHSAGGAGPGHVQANLTMPDSRAVWYTDPLSCLSTSRGACGGQCFGPHVRGGREGRTCHPHLAPRVDPWCSDVAPGPLPRAPWPPGAFLDLLWEAKATNEVPETSGAPRRHQPRAARWAEGRPGCGRRLGRVLGLPEHVTAAVGAWGTCPWVLGTGRGRAGGRGTGKGHDASGAHG